MGSPTFVRYRGVLGVLFIAFGTTIVVRTYLQVGPSWQLLSPLVLGLAFVLLGILRVRDALAVGRRNP